LTKQEIKILDTIWSYAIKERDGFKCRYTGCSQTKYLNSHHIIKRQFKALRWDIDNGITLCVGHHTFGKDAAHVDEIGFLKWLKEIGIDYNFLHRIRLIENNFNFAEQLEELREDCIELNLNESLKLIYKYKNKDLTVTKRKKVSRKLFGIKALREKSGLTSESVARLLNVKEGIYEKIENGRKTVSPAKIKKLAIIFKVKLGDLYEV
jgi:DNA-binding transcriptional regulator YiaG